jgi:hypothetical protein
MLVASILVLATAIKWDYGENSPLDMDFLTQPFFANWPA